MDVTLVTVSRPETTATVTRGAARLLVALGYAPLSEVTLPNGRGLGSGDGDEGDVHGGTLFGLRSGFKSQKRPPGLLGGRALRMDVETTRRRSGSGGPFRQS